jgi:hypothetical protein
MYKKIKKKYRTRIFKITDDKIYKETRKREKERNKFKFF